MILDRILDFAHLLLEKAVDEGDIVIDATCGNGNDTLFLTKLIGDTGHVYGIDIQQDAVEATKCRILEEGMEKRATIIQDSHAYVENHLSVQHKTSVQAAIFNLGYLPGSDKSIITTPKETITSVKRLLSLLNKGGLIVLVVYHGHPGGKEERDALLKYVASLDHKDYHVLNYGFINQKRTPPFILAIEKH